MAKDVLAYLSGTAGERRPSARTAGYLHHRQRGGSPEGEKVGLDPVTSVQFYPP